jgi:VanZ family protein
MARVTVPLAAQRVRWGVVAAVAAAILVASLVPTPDRPTATGPFGVGTDRYVHAAAYAGLAASIGYASVAGRTERVLTVAFLGAVAFGLVVELLQAPVPSRSASHLDVVANVVGAAVATGTWPLAREFVTFRPRAR